MDIGKYMQENCDKHFASGLPGGCYIVDEGTGLLAAGRSIPYIKERLTICQIHRKNTLAAQFCTKDDDRAVQLYWKAHNCCTSKQQAKVKIEVECLSDELEELHRGNVNYSFYESVYADSMSLLKYWPRPAA